MPEGSGDKPTPIRPNIDVLPPNVTPLQKGAEPQNPGRRNFLKKAGGFALGLAGAFGLAAGAGHAVNKLTEPIKSPSPPSNAGDKDKHEQEMRARGLPTNKGPENYDSFTLEQMAKLKTQHQANSQPSPSPDQKNK